MCVQGFGCQLKIRSGRLIKLSEIYRQKYGILSCIIAYEIWEIQMMGQKRYGKRLLSLALGLCMLCSQTAYADITIVPMPWAEAGTSENGTAAGNMQYGPGVQGSLPMPGIQTTPGLSGAQTTPGTQTTPGSQTSQSGTGENAQAGTSGSTGQTALTEPAVAAEGAVLMDASTGQVLYGKNQDTQFYPASITKVMTALLVLEHCSLDDVVTFSASATTNLESGAVSLNITEGDKLTVEQALYGLLLKSANEIGNGLAEHVSGSISAFADLMNEKAKSLGCKNTHFANPHGLNDSTHKTTPYDMALILRAALQNDTFRKIDTTLTYEFPATKNAVARTITMGHKMMYPSDSRYYEGIIGGKTGYTSLAGNTLVTGAERNGVRLIAVVMKSKSTHYADTKAMLDYGFENYEALTGKSSTTDTSSQVSGPASAHQGASQAQTAGNSVPQTPVSGNGTSQTPAVGTGTDTGWKKDGERWYYIRQDGQRAAGEWQTLNGLDYWFDADGYMATGWRRFTNGAWYYFRSPDGYAVKSAWVQDGGNWYYLGADGVLLTNTTTPDGYPVDENGIWKQG